MFKSIILSLFVISSAFAGEFKENYLENTLVPEGLQDDIMAGILHKYPCLVTALEESTTVETKSIDQGNDDTYYTTTFSAFGYIAGDNGNNAKIVVQSAEYGFSNPAFSPYEILSIQAETNICN